MTLRELVTKHPEFLDHTLVIYTDGGYDYVSDGVVLDQTLPNWRGSVYEAEEMVDVEGKDCVPTGRNVLVFSPN